MLGLPTQTLITLKMDQVIQAEAVTYLRYYKIPYNTPVYQALVDIESEFEKWEKWEDKGGRWTTRFSKLLKTKYNYKLQPNMRAVIGETLQRYMEKDHYVVISPTIDWKDGDFGDEYSCWVGDKPKDLSYTASVEGWKCGRVLGKLPDAYAIKMYKDVEAYNKNKSKGIGRCWAYVLNGGLYLFNLMGGARSTIANALSLQLGGLPIKSIGYDIKIGWSRHTERGYYIGNGAPVQRFHWEKFWEEEEE